MASDTLFFQLTLQRRWTIIHNLPHVKGIFKNVKPSMKFNVLIFRCINIFVYLPLKFKKTSENAASPKEGKESPTKNHQFSVENSWKIQGNLPRLEPWNPPTQIASMDRWVNRQGRLTCVGFYSQGLNHFSSFFFLHEKTWNKKNIYTFFLAFLWFSLSITGRFSFFSWLSSFPRSPPQRPLLEGYPPAFFTGFRERKHQKEQK